MRKVLRGSLGRLAMANQRQFNSFLTRSQAWEILKCIQIAESCGVSLDMVLNINLDLVKAEQPVQEKITDLLNYISQWVRRNGRDLFYLWILENPNEVLNIHILMHVTGRRRDDLVVLRRNIKKWIKLVFGKYEGRTVDLKNRRSLEGVAQYILKGAGEGVCSALDADLFDQGVIFGRRWNCSNNLRKATREIPLTTEYFGLTGVKSDAGELEWVPTKRAFRGGIAPMLHQLQLSFPEFRSQTSCQPWRP